MQTVEIQDTHFSKVICGTNPFYGHSHFSDARKKEYLNRFTDAYITETLTPDEATLQIGELLNNPQLFENSPMGKSLQKKMVELQKVAHAPDPRNRGMIVNE